VSRFRLAKHWMGTYPAVYNGRKKVLVLWGYFDESGKFADSDFVCLCGYLSDDRWDKFASDWGFLLVRHGLTSLHLSKVDWKDHKQVSALTEFVRPIREHVFCGFSIAVDAKYYRSMPIEKRRVLGDKDPREFTFHRLLRIVRDYLKERGQDDWLSLTFDYEEGFSVQCLKSLMKLRKERDYIKTLVRNIGFADDEMFHPLQAADMFAYGYRRSLQGVAPEYYRILTAPVTETNPGPPCMTLFYDADLLEKTYLDLRG
jgi:Protein of unknown function (DUF3800)